MTINGMFNDMVKMEKKAFGELLDYVSHNAVEKKDRDELATKSKWLGVALVVAGVAVGALGISCLAAGPSGIAGLVILGTVSAALIIAGHDMFKAGNNIGNMSGLTELLKYGEANGGKQLKKGAKLVDDIFGTNIEKDVNPYKQRWNTLTKGTILAKPLGNAFINHVMMKV